MEVSEKKIPFANKFVMLNTLDFVYMLHGLNYFKLSIVSFNRWTTSVGGRRENNQGKMSRGKKFALFL